ncbi:hypothetical protein, partial [Duganella qianjiadongensis]|uniref:hypothetical protein n=1 Tax=Duganella qianjiadongensis TaxID=2692176 RepID=UPI001E4F276C
MQIVDLVSNSTSLKKSTWVSAFSTLNLVSRELYSYCSGLMYPDTDLGENTRHGEVFDEQAETYVFPGVQTAGCMPGA